MKSVSLQRLYALAFLYKLMLVFFCFSMVGIRYLIGVPTADTMPWFNPTATQEQLFNALSVENPPVDAYNQLGHTGLSFSAQQGNLYLADLLLEKGAQLSIGSRETTYKALQSLNTPLHWSVSNGEVNGAPPILKLFLEWGANTAARNFEGKTPAHLVADISMDKIRADILATLFYFGADFNIQDEEGNTVTHRIAATDDWQWMQVFFIPLFNDVINVTLKNKGTPDRAAATPSEFAYQLGFRDYARYFDQALKPRLGIDGKANQFNTLGLSGLMVAAWWDDIKTAQLLVKNKESVNIISQGAYAYTPLHFAFMRANSKSALWLLQQGANFQKSNALGYLPLHMLIWAPREKQMAFLQLLKSKITSGILNAPDKKGDTLLHLAVRANQSGLVGSLLTLFNKDSKSSTKCDLSLKNNEGLTPLGLAQKLRRTSIIPLLSRPVTAAFPKKTLAVPAHTTTA